MSCFQNSAYLKSLFIKFSFSINLNTSLLQIGQYGIRLGSLVRSFRDPFGLSCHIFDWKAILGTPKKICGGNFVLHHKPTQWFNKEFGKIHINMPYPLEKIPQFMTPCMIAFVVILDTIWLVTACALVTLDKLVRISNHWISTWHSTWCSHMGKFSNHIKQVIFIVEVDPMWY
jgi:hypothetical protein